MGTGFLGCKERPGRDADSSPLLVPRSRRVELYLYSTYGPYGLHRASVPVQGRTVAFHYIQDISNSVIEYGEQNAIDSLVFLP